MAALSIAVDEADDSASTEALLADPIFSKASYLGLARLLPYITERTMASGD